MNGNVLLKTNVILIKENEHEHRHSNAESCDECCGNGIAVERNAEEVIAEMAARHRELTAVIAHKPASGEA